MMWRNSVKTYSIADMPPLTLARRFWLMWLDIEGRLFPKFHARRYSLRRFIEKAV